MSVDGFSETSTIRNLYARREVRDHTDSEWQAYVDALWILQRTQTSSGRELYGANCPTGDARDYHENEYFVMIHAALSFNTTADQLHFNSLQEFAHQGWNHMLEKSLQCVDPSVSLPWWNGAYDQVFHGSEDSAEKYSMLKYMCWQIKKQ